MAGPAARDDYLPGLADSAQRIVADQFAEIAPTASACTRLVGKPFAPGATDVPFETATVRRTFGSAWDTVVSRFGQNS
ncbi:hypothetical protein [Candidatus Mycolicibacterium alkanivorans]|uniref:Uncharacterized protein n=1 Tax=Candidatus Mycolicibacterium alkanivorans TaxID=2954114 RepID=A0ABS9YX23_9MYCO|nr:hypothetical protein [Candidatus Mycolicibacterium alkanivorans]MCI4675779.1 hypothetical protein [Candidatus Mycolicibacterium alkanivorans]